MHSYFTDWPDGFSFETDDVCQTRFKPFIEEQMSALAAYDAQRPEDITYVFHEHAERVAKDIERTCVHLGLSDTVARNMYWAALPHDIGKSRLPLEAWDSEEKPTDGMKKFRRTHTLLGAQIVQELFHDIEHPFKDLMIDIMAYHHEHMDGSGEHGLSGDKLSASVRLTAIVEAYDGYRIWRPHFGDRDISPAAVIEKLRREKGAEIYDMNLLNVFAEMKLSGYKDD